MLNEKSIFMLPFQSLLIWILIPAVSLMPVSAIIALISLITALISVFMLSPVAVAGLTVVIAAIAMTAVIALIATTTAAMTALAMTSATTVAAVLFVAAIFIVKQCRCGLSLTPTSLMLLFRGKPGYDLINYSINIKINSFKI